MMADKMLKTELENITEKCNIPNNYTQNSNSLLHQEHNSAACNHRFKRITASFFIPF